MNSQITVHELGENKNQFAYAQAPTVKLFAITGKSDIIPQFISLSTLHEEEDYKKFWDSNEFILKLRARAKCSVIGARWKLVVFHHIWDFSDPKAVVYQRSNELNLFYSFLDFLSLFSLLSLNLGLILFLMFRESSFLESSMASPIILTLHWMTSRVSPTSGHRDVLEIVHILIVTDARHFRLFECDCRK